MSWRIVYSPWPAGGWPQKPTDLPYRSPFKAPWSNTRQLLFDEVRKLQNPTDPDEAVICVDVDERGVRLDGGLRADVRPRSPGVIVMFESRHGPQRYVCDRFDWWEDNVRAVALGLENLRRIERYGIARDGQQYTGWKAIGTGIAVGPASMTVEQAARYISDHCGVDWSSETDDDPSFALALYKDAAKLHHPDRGGDAEVFKRLVDAKAILDKEFPQ